MSRILLVRHGQTDWNQNDRIQGWGGVPLNDRGRRQASAAARYLAHDHPDVRRVVSSDLPRAVETTAAIADAEPYADVEVRYDSAWRERDFGVYQGRCGTTFFEDHPEFAVIEGGDAAQTTVPEEGECYVAFRERVLRAWRALRRDASGTVVVVTHCGPIRAVVAEIEGMDAASAHVEVETDNCGITEIEVDDAARLDAVNRVEHLAGDA